jgi:uncharacterized protein (DUF1684 family)
MKLTFVLAFLFPVFLSAQNPVKEAKKFRKEINKQYGDEDKSPLKEADRANFKKLEFYDIDSEFAVQAKLDWFEKDSVFEMKTTTARLAKYRRSGVATFILDGNELELVFYQNVKGAANPLYKDYYFLPFKDNTNGEESYGGGRYIDLIIDEGSADAQINFNVAYNPYCAYNDRYSCPIVPSENYINIEIKAGVKAPAEH